MVYGRMGKLSCSEHAGPISDVLHAIVIVVGFSWLMLIVSGDDRGPLVLAMTDPFAAAPEDDSVEGAQAVENRAGTCEEAQDEDNVNAEPALYRVLDDVIEEEMRRVGDVLD